MNDARLEHLKRFYSILGRLEQDLGGAKTLAEGKGRMNWPNRGVYFFREPDEMRSDTGTGPRIVRVGTHALKAGGSTTLWGRLYRAYSVHAHTSFPITFVEIKLDSRYE